MSHLKKFLFVFCFFMLIPFSSIYASDIINSSSIEKNITVIVTNDQTGEKNIKTYDSNNFKTRSINSLYSNESTSTIGYEIFIPIESSKDQDVISPLTIDGGIKDSGGVTARLYVDYNWISSTGNLRINKVYGSWTPKSSIYRVSDRVVRAHNGGLFSNLKKLYRTPTVNSFSYTTGWGYNYSVTGSDGANAQSSAKISVDGMGGSHTVAVIVYVP